MNVANVPEIRDIEDFCGYLKRNVYKDSWQAKISDQLKKRIPVYPKYRGHGRTEA